MSAIEWAAKRRFATSSLGVHIHIGWDSKEVYPACCEEPSFLRSLKLRLVDVFDSRTSLIARSVLEKCVQDVEADGFFCERDGIWLQICRL